MSDNRRNPTNLLNNDRLRTTSALKGILSVLGKNPMGATCAGPIAIEPLKRCATERSSAGKPDAAAIDPTSSLYGRPGGASAMIQPVVDPFKVKDITAMSSGLLHAEAKSAIRDDNISALTEARRGSRCTRSVAASKGSRWPGHALPVKRASGARSESRGRQ
jgi:hypothetical protein